MLSNLQKLRNAFEVDLALARQERESAVLSLNIADAKITAARNAIDRVDKFIADEEKAKGQ